MKTKLFNRWLAIRHSFWFVPTLMAILAIVLAFVMSALDGVVEEEWSRNWNWLYATGPEGARAVLAAIAGSMIGLAGVVFSITIVTLTLASSQFGPRLLRNFMRDPGNQIVLGTFIATFTYCLLVLRTVQGRDEQTFVPTLSVALGVLLALLSLGVLIYFIHHVSASIQADNILVAVSRDIDDAIERLFPDRLGRDIPLPEAHQMASDLPPRFAHQARSVPALRGGYLQAVDSEGLFRIASERDLVVRLMYRPGQFIVPKSTLMLVWPDRGIDEQFVRDINGVTVLGPQRTHEQDPTFAFSQMIEIAMRALSPGINDPATASACLEWLGAGLCQLAERELPSPYRYDDHHTLRLIAPTVTFEEIANLIFTRIRQYSRSSIMVTFKLLETIAVIAPYVHREADRTALRQQAIMIERGSHEGLPEEWDRQEVLEYYHIAMRALGEQTPPLQTPYERKVHPESPINMP